MLAVIAALIPVFLLIVTGFALRRWLIQDDAHWIGLERLLYYVMFPALLVESLSRADLSKVPVLAVGGTLLTAVLLMTALCLALTAAARPPSRHQRRRVHLAVPGLDPLADLRGARRRRKSLRRPRPRARLGGDGRDDPGAQCARRVGARALRDTRAPGLAQRRAGDRAKSLHLGLRHRPCPEPARRVDPGARTRICRCARALIAGPRAADRRRGPAHRRIDPSERHDVSRLRAQADRDAGNRDRRSAWRSASPARTSRWSRAVRPCRRRPIPMCWRARWAATRR